MRSSRRGLRDVSRQVLPLAEMRKPGVWLISRSVASGVDCMHPTLIGDRLNG